MKMPRFSLGPLLAAVNVGQGAIIAFGLVLVMGFAGWDIQSGRMSVGDFVAVNTYLLQLYLPLNFLGYVCRECVRALSILSVCLV